MILRSEEFVTILDDSGKKHSMRRGQIILIEELGADAIRVEFHTGNGPNNSFITNTSHDDLMELLMGPDDEGK